MSMVPGANDAREMERAQRNIEDMDSALDMDFTGWDPDAQPKVTGLVLYVTTAGQDSEYGEYPLVAVVQADGTPLALHCFHTTLRSAIQRWNPEPGDVIGVKYKGRKTEGGFGDKGYEDYNVIVQKKSLH